MSNEKSKMSKEIEEFQIWVDYHTTNNGQWDYHFDWNLPEEQWSNLQGLYYLQSKNNTLNPDGTVRISDWQSINQEASNFRLELMKEYINIRDVQPSDAQTAMRNGWKMKVLEQQIRDLGELCKPNKTSMVKEKVLEQLQPQIDNLVKFIAEKQIKQYQLKIKLELPEVDF